MLRSGVTSELSVGTRVDGIIGGFPCTDLSVAGKQLGISEDTRSGLWFEYLRLIRLFRPKWIAIENVPAVIAYPAGGIVFRGLHECGYDAEWISLRAGDVGAPHGRKRVFILAHCQSGRRRERWQSSRSNGFTDGSHERMEYSKHAGSSPTRPAPECETTADQSIGPGEMVDAARHGGDGCEREAGSGRGIRQTGEPLEYAEDDHGRRRISGAETGIGTHRIRRRRSAGTSGDVGNANEPGLERRSVPDGERTGERIAGPSERQLANTNDGTGGEQRGKQSGERGAVAGQSCDLGIFPPGPADADRWLDLLVRHPELRPAISQAEIESALCGMADGLAYLVDYSRTDALRMLGNGIVPIQAAVAFTILAGRIA